MSYSLTVTESGGLTLGLTGPAGPTGPAGGVTSVAGRTGAITLVSADITNASTGGFGTADNGKLVKFNSTGGASFRSDAVDTFAVSADSSFGSGLYGASTEGYGVFAVSDLDRALYAVSISGAAVYATCDTSTGSVSISSQGTYHALFGDTGSNRSFIARINGALGWFRGAFTGRILAPATLAADVTWTLPTTGGNLARVASAAGTIVSEDVSDATETSTPDTIVRRDSNGDFFGEACGFSTITVASDVYGATFTEASTPTNKLTADRAYLLSDASGNIPIVPAYASLTAANAALPANEFYWDTTDKKLRVTTV